MISEELEKETHLSTKLKNAAWMLK
jgi:hypothetical protein